MRTGEICNKKKSGEEKLSTIMPSIQLVRYNDRLGRNDGNRCPLGSVDQNLLFSRNRLPEGVFGFLFLFFHPRQNTQHREKVIGIAGFKEYAPVYLEVIGPWKTKHGGRKRFGWNNVEVVGYWKESLFLNVG